MKKLIWLPIFVVAGFMAGMAGSVVAAPLSEDGKLQVVSGAFAAVADVAQLAFNAIIQIFTAAIAG